MSLTIGYLVEFGYLNLPRFHKYLEELSQVSNFPFNLHYFKMHYIYNFAEVDLFFKIRNR